MYIAIINKQEYKFPTLEETAKFLYNKTKLLSSQGKIEFAFDVYYEENHQRLNLNKTETDSFNRYCKDLWEQHATPKEITILAEYKEKQLEKEKKNAN